MNYGDSSRISITVQICWIGSVLSGRSKLPAERSKTVQHASHFPGCRSIVIGIHWEREALRRRITDRLRERLDNGMIEEVERLHASGIAWERLDYYGLEYRYVGAYLRGEMNRNDMFQRLNSAIHNFAKRQGNWFRRMERHGVVINWIEGAGDQWRRPENYQKRLCHLTGRLVPRLSRNYR